MSIKNQKYTELRITEINITSDEKYRFRSFNRSIDPGEDVSIGIQGFQISNTCNELELIMKYDKPPLKSQKLHGVIQAPLEFS